MFSLASIKSHTDLAVWQDKVKKVCENIPLVAIGNKLDLVSPKTKVTVFDGEKKLPVYCVSTKTNENYEKPFLHLAKHFLGDDTYFVQP